MRNIARAKVIQAPRAGFQGPDAASATELLTAANVANASMASVGKFQVKPTNKKQDRGIGVAAKQHATMKVATPVGEKKAFEAKVQKGTV
ncbi:ribosome biogenesis regulatory protein [Culex quinquefasciatus]|uniref:Ribosome biogenesis regulatory protein n=1 Tax=Culex quinquefasciatus TaxID=7176 RepID=B0WE84_CULQU|nr:ribosome biogenesis regulatory protein [Culex quinquefasciatus]|eukprot:XP_001847018.1 ribosome biogenesis regulatory protein [Culex quinquefasciatus]